MKLILLHIWILFCIAGHAQNTNLISGPWAGNIELRNATIWAEVSPSTKSVAVNYFPLANARLVKTIAYKGPLGQDFNPVKLELNGLDINTKYGYQLIVNGIAVKTPFETTFATKELWQYRKAAPDFSFLAGSCAYFNESIYDRPGNPYGGDSSIFETMAKTQANFHIWMGDNWYTREVDYSSVWGLYYRASRDRSHNVVQKFMASMPQYAIWDDHDYGPNDAGKSFIFKTESRDVFKKYSLNPSYGEQNEGIYTMFSQSDCDFFLTDDRFFRSEPEISDSVNGKLNPNKAFFGRMQLEWLKNQLLYSRATFKFVVVGSQVLNPLNNFECMLAYPTERAELLNFIRDKKINGVVFLSGDRHHSEVIKLTDGLNYPLYDITISPYTAGISRARGEEANNIYRVAGTLVEKQNFGKISVSGKKNERVLKLENIGLNGEKLAEWMISENELKAK